MADQGEDTFATTMKRLRTGLGLSQMEAADQAGVSRTLWRQLEEGIHAYRPRRHNVVKVARQLRWDLADAMRAAGHAEPPTDIELEEVQRRDALTQLTRLWRDLTEPQKLALVHSASVMANPARYWTQERDELEGPDPDTAYTSREDANAPMER